MPYAPRGPAISRKGVIRRPRPNVQPVARLSEPPLNGPGLCATAAAPRLLNLWGRGRLPLQLGNPVAQLRRPLELQVRGRRQHLAVQLLQVLLGDVVLGLMAGDLGDLLTRC